MSNVTDLETAYFRVRNMIDNIPVEYDAILQDVANKTADIVQASLDIDDEAERLGFLANVSGGIGDTMTAQFQRIAAVHGYWDEETGEYGCNGDEVVAFIQLQEFTRVLVCALHLNGLGADDCMTVLDKVCEVNREFFFMANIIATLEGEPEQADLGRLEYPAC